MLEFILISAAAGAVKGSYSCYLYSCDVDTVYAFCDKNLLK